MVGNFVSLVMLQGINFLLPLIAMPYLVRILGVERYGFTMFGYALIQYFIMFTDFGFNLSGTKYISQNRDNPDKINTYLNSAMMGRMLLCSMSFLVLLILICCFDRFKTDSIFYLSYFGMVIGNAMFPVWFFQGMERMKYMTIFYLAAKVLTFFPFFIFIKKAEDYFYVPIFYSAGYIFAGCISLYFVYIQMNMKWFLPSVKQIKFALTDSSTYFLSRLSTSLFTTNNLFVLGLVYGNTVTGNTIVGFYSAAEKLYQAYTQLLGPFTGVLFPHIAKTRDVRFFKNALTKVFFTNLIVLTGVILCGELILYLVYDRVDPETLSVFRILLTACYVTYPSMLLGYPFLAAMGHPTYTNSTTIITSFVHITGLFILFFTKQLNLYTVAIMVVVSESFLLFLRARGVIKFKLMKQ